MTDHIFKLDPVRFETILQGIQKAIIRIDPHRNFKAGDTITLREVIDDVPIYTGRAYRTIITHVLRGPYYGLHDDYSMLSLNGGGWLVSDYESKRIATVSLR